MALFGKNKGDAPENNGESPKAENGAFDFDSIARDLEAQDGPSPFDSLLSKPVGEGDNVFDMNQLPSVDGIPGGSAFDFPDAEVLPEVVDEVPKRNVIASSSSTDLDNLDDLFGAPATPKSSAADVAAVSDSFPDIPLTTPSAKSKATARSAAPAPIGVPEPAAVPPSPASGAKKSLPLIPLLGVGAVLVLGGAGWFFTQSGSSDIDSEGGDAVPIATPLSGAPDSPVEGVPPTVPTAAAAAPQLPPTGVRPPVPGEPGVPPGAPPSPDSPVARPSAVRPPAPAMPSGAPAAPADANVDPETLTQLKNLWEQGKNAKDRKDFVSARMFWEQALRIKPGHPGFKESIDKLPK